MKKTTSQVLSIISLVLVATLIMTVVILAIVPVSKSMTFATNENGNLSEADKPDQIVVRTDSSNRKEAIYYKDIEEDKAIYNKLWNAYNDAGTYKVLDTLFIGIVGKHASTEKLTGTSTSTLYNSSTKYCMIFVWNTDREIKYTYNGNDYTKQYNKVYIPITEDNMIVKTNLYAVSNSYAVSSGYSSYGYNVYLNTANLYKIVKDLSYGVY